MNLEQTRKDFPLLNNGHKLICFDNACSTLRPVSVIDAISQYYRDYPVCAGRSSYSLAVSLTEKCEASRKTISKFINAKNPKEIVFVKNATEGINLVAHSLNLEKGDIVLTTDKEHNSNLVPWQVLQSKSGIVHKVVFSNQDNTFDLESFKDAMSSEVKLVAMVWTSNLDGVTNPAKEIIEITHQYGSKVLLDATQVAGHRKIDVADLDVDFLVFSGHKILGPCGVGVLYGKQNILDGLDPFLTGGGTVSYSDYERHELLFSPEKFEAGIQDYAGILGLGEAVKYLEKVGFDNIAKQEYELNEFITSELEKNAFVKIIGPADASLRGGIFSFWIEGMESHQVAIMLEQMGGIMVRSGQHCVNSWFNARGIKSSVRASIYFYNTMDEAKIFVDAVNKITKLL
ncbi:MAG: aminotransferase class V-fold PLP-dependent enzyme [Candidatus Moranbacteria bacterium]|nr:aminotransferase class V-fold PLP-dependent enzyme [Candidatus Moranbacteria bacterium]